MATLVLKKSTAGDFFVNDVGIIIPGSGQDTFTDQEMITMVARSKYVQTAVSDGIADPSSRRSRPTS